MYLLLTTLVIFSAATKHVFSQNSSPEELFESLLETYHMKIIPGRERNQPANVSVMFSLFMINSLDEAKQTFTTTGSLILEWVDKRLSWNPDEAGQITRLHMDAKQIWTPEFALINGAEEFIHDYSNFQLIVNSDGLVHWEPGGMFKTICQVDLTYFPNDKQTCSFIFGSWSYNTNEVNLTTRSSAVNLDSYEVNGEFEITGTKSRRYEFFFDCCPDEKFSNIKFDIELKRRPSYYFINIVLPTILTSLLLLTIFLCPPEYKVEICLVVIVSFRLLMLDVASVLPKTSDAIPLLSVYLISTLTITAVTMMLAVFVLNLHHINDKPVPEWIRKVVLDGLGRVVCVRNTHNNVNDCQNHGEKMTMEIIPGNEMHKKPNYENDWKRVANVLDRCFFWIILVAVVISLIVFLHPLISGS